MPRLEKVAGLFERTPMWCAYTGRKLKARCQITAWDTPRRDGMTTIRRTFTLRPGDTLPKRNAVIVGGQTWIVSKIPNIDTWGVHNSRAGYVAQYAEPGLVARTEEVLSGGGLPVYMSRVWVKDVKDIMTTSETQGQYYVYYTHGEPVEEGEFIDICGRLHIVRNLVSGTAGLMIAEVNELERDCVVDVLVQSEGVYDPVTETYENGDDALFKAVMMTWKDDYAHELASRAPEHTGDKRLRIAAADAGRVAQDARLVVDGAEYVVVEIDRRKHGAVSVSIRRV
ncbi:hypothetical protein V9W64_10865 [Neisseria leonii]|uniref:Uncharacterized protein n=1 Tax=Neisseria leonii TaxID=2995413 RepID=A0A9X4ID47_9NEIS|nr:hypothetical protein [Neisseria sp. 51.81]MDD9326743.1 hypothetical protein [Neisseria sp. 51.81]